MMCIGMIHKLILATTVLLIGTGLGLFLVGPGYIERAQNRVLPHAPFEVSDDARALHAQLHLADLHADSLLWERDLLERSDRGQVDIPRLREGRYALQVFATVTKSPSGQNFSSNSADASDNITLLAMLQR